ncbi:hypothetical protein [Paenibacillus hamazuiensis]|uniref:hypothetical protein n=1 Tax=Paenibacillus hamazuiensis TaxID=2936508 RepID=UPI00200C9936|nr:hypothetical protein [Paenibacillus hamazuiensis]
MKKIGVGIIGASTNGTWGGLAHVPALLALPEEGDLVLQSNDNFMFQIDSFTVKGTQRSKNLEVLPVPEQYIALPAALAPGPAYNVAGLYRQISADLQDNSHTAPDFRTALEVHRLIDAVQRAADTGIRQLVK